MHTFHTTRQQKTLLVIKYRNRTTVEFELTTYQFKGTVKLPTRVVTASLDGYLEFKKIQLITSFIIYSWFHYTMWFNSTQNRHVKSFGTKNFKISFLNNIYHNVAIRDCLFDNFFRKVYMYNIWHFGIESRGRSMFCNEFGCIKKMFCKILYLKT